MNGNGSDAPALSRSRKLLFWTILLLSPLLLLELGTRFIWWSRGISFLRPDYLARFYPDLRGVEETQIQRGDPRIDVLLLGGSVLHPDWGEVALRLEEQLGRRTDREVAVHQLAAPGQSSLDSFYKYRRLGAQRFDLVIFYHGINEARANNAPPEVFRDDYAHYSWYERVNAALDQHRGYPWLVSPYLLRTLWLRARPYLFADHYVSADRPNPAWLRYGSVVRTAGPFRHSLRGILELARERGDPVLLMTFAYYRHPDYDETAFRKGRLGYAGEGLPIESWGNPDHVVAAIEAHNHVVRELSREFGPYFVDQAARMPEDARLFRDICHFSDEGSRVFVDNLLDVAIAAVQAGNDQ